MKLLLIAALLFHIGITCYGQPGALDSTFGTDGIAIDGTSGVNSGGHGLAIQSSDSKIILVGWGDSALVRYNTNGTVDRTFGNHGKVALTGLSITTQPDGKFIVNGGIFKNLTATRCLNNGYPDTSFNGTGTIKLSNGGYWYTSSIQADGKIVLAGSINDNMSAVRYTANGLIDSSFNGDGKIIANLGGYSAEAHAALIQPSGNIVLAGYTYLVDSFGRNTKDDFTLLRYKPDGSIDSSFGKKNGITITDFAGSYDFARAATLLPDGKILVAGSSAQPTSGDDFALARYTADGIPESTFGTYGRTTADIDTGESDVAYGMAVQQDGKIVLAGRSYGAVEAVFSLARFNANGSLDSSFGKKGKVITNIGGYDDRIEGVAIQPDGKIVVAGSTGDASHHGIYHIALARYLADYRVAVPSIKQQPGDIQIYPNPAMHDIAFRAPSLRGEKQLRIFDMTGRLVWEQSLQFANGNAKIHIELAPGIYEARLLDQQSRTVSTTKLVIAK